MARRVPSGNTAFVGRFVLQFPRATDIASEVNAESPIRIVVTSTVTVPSAQTLMPAVSRPIVERAKQRRNSLLFVNVGHESIFFKDCKCLW